ncbi:MAG: hypothetical protein MJZ20_09500 [Bacteroidaceae bacterium]|nr:hypothetical protein [Bacteroidaceae bacterium]
MEKYKFISYKDYYTGLKKEHLKNGNTVAADNCDYRMAIAKALGHLYESVNDPRDLEFIDYEVDNYGFGITILGGI